MKKINEKYIPVKNIIKLKSLTNETLLIPEYNIVYKNLK